MAPVLVPLTVSVYTSSVNIITCDRHLRHLYHQKAKCYAPFFSLVFILTSAVLNLIKPDSPFFGG